MVTSATGFPKVARLRRRAEFLALQRDGVRWHMPSFVVIRTGSRGDQSRIGITVSRRVGNAVNRNRLKRIIREIFRTNRRDVTPAQDVLVIARTNAQKLNYAQVASELERVFRSSGSAQ